jgi:RHS repeat-associated protein
VAGGTTTHYVHGLGGLLSGEYDNTGVLIREYVWLNGEPLAQILKSGGTESVTYLHTDHLATPRTGTNAAGSTVWTWDSGAFGKEAPTGTATVNLRFPGQYFDAETTLNYNWHRYYDSSTGRYITSDPIGLTGGLNTYGYAVQSPLNAIDRNGLNSVWSWVEGIAGIFIPTPQDIADVSEASWAWWCNMMSSNRSNLTKAGDSLAAAAVILMTIGPGGRAKRASDIAVEVSEEAVEGLTKAIKKSTAKDPKHHLCTDKNCISAARGGPWTPRFKELLEGAGIDLNDVENIVRVAGHKGPHPEEYHEYLYEKLLESVEGLKRGTSEYREAIEKVLEQTGREANMPGSQVNIWLTKP